MPKLRLNRKIRLLLIIGCRQGFRQDLGNWVCKKNTGCVKFWLATLAINSFSFLPHLQPQKQFFRPFIKYCPIVKKNLKNVFFLFFWPFIF